jgi:hypothetical protein
MADINKSDGTTPRLFIEPDGTRVLMNWTSKQNRKEIKPRKDKTIENAPLTADERKQKGEMAALELAYKYPDKAIQGLDRRGFDEAHRVGRTINSETGEIS